MSKILVPQELQEQIVDLYVNKNYTRVQIKKELNLAFGDSVILRILKEHNVEIRNNPGAKKGGRKKQEVSQELQQQIIELYNYGYGLEAIIKKLSLPFSFDKVRSILKDNNIAIRSIAEASQVKIMPDLRKYSINDNYNFESHNGAWILGFIAADGYLPLGRGSQNRITITLARKDEEVLYIIAKELSYSGPIYQFESTEGYECSSLSFTSQKIRQSIEKYGIGNNKTFKLKHLPFNLNDDFMIDYLRGYFDGDGSILEPQGKKINISLVSANKEFLESVSYYLNNKLKLKIPTIHSVERKHTIYDIKYYTKDSFLLGEAFYNNDFLALPRKKKHYLEIAKKYL